jgi:hypothetical protein
MQFFPVCRTKNRDRRRRTEWVLRRETERRNSSTAKMHSMEADNHRLSDQVGQLQSKLDRAALHRDLIVGMELQKKDPRVSGYQKGQVLYKQPAEAPDERRFRIFRKLILQISGPISGRMPRYRVLMTRYRKPQYRDTP